MFETFEKSEISDQMIILITKPSYLQVKRAIQQSPPTPLLVIHFSQTGAHLPNCRRKAVHLL